MRQRVMPGSPARLWPLSLGKPTSAAQDDILRSYQLHASAYVTKPTGFDLFIDAIRKVNNFYLASPGCPTETRHGPMIIRRAGRLSSERTLVMRDR
jgi:hypothetical protein